MFADHAGIGLSFAVTDRTMYPIGDANGGLTDTREVFENICGSGYDDLRNGEPERAPSEISLNRFGVPHEYIDVSELIACEVEPWHVPGAEEVLVTFEFDDGDVIYNAPPSVELEPDDEYTEMAREHGLIDVDDYDDAEPWRVATVAPLAKMIEDDDDCDDDWNDDCDDDWRDDDFDAGWYEAECDLSQPFDLEGEYECWERLEAAAEVADDELASMFDREIERERLAGLMWDIKDHNWYRNSRRSGSKRVHTGPRPHSNTRYPFCHAPGLDFDAIRARVMAEQQQPRHELESWLAGRGVIERDRKLFWGEFTREVKTGKRVFSPKVDTWVDEMRPLFRQGCEFSASDYAHWATLDESLRQIARGSEPPKERQSTGSFTWQDRQQSWKRRFGSKVARQWQRPGDTHIGRPQGRFEQFAASVADWVPTELLETDIDFEADAEEALQRIADDVPSLVDDPLYDPIGDPWGERICDAYEVPPSAFVDPEREFGCHGWDTDGLFEEWLMSEPSDDYDDWAFNWLGSACGVIDLHYAEERELAVRLRARGASREEDLRADERFERHLAQGDRRRFIDVQYRLDNRYGGQRTTEASRSHRGRQWQKHRPNDSVRRCDKNCRPLEAEGDQQNARAHN